MAGPYVGLKLCADRLGCGVGHDLSPQLSVARHDAHDSNLVRAALAVGSALVSVLVLFLAAHVGFVCLNHSFKRAIEGRRARRMTQAVENDPCRLLRDLDVLGELRGCDAFGVTRHHPNRYEPLAGRQLRILENRADVVGEPLAAVAALVDPIVGEVVQIDKALLAQDNNIESDRVQFL